MTGTVHEHTHEHERPHEHPGGLRGLAREVFVPHSHNAAESIDDAMTAHSDACAR